MRTELWELLGLLIIIFTGAALSLFSWIIKQSVVEALLEYDKRKFEIEKANQKYRQGFIDHGLNPPF